MKKYRSKAWESWIEPKKDIGPRRWAEREKVRFMVERISSCGECAALFPHTHLNSPSRHRRCFVPYFSAGRKGSRGLIVPQPSKPPCSVWLGFPTSLLPVRSRCRTELTNMGPLSFGQRPCTLGASLSCPMRAVVWLWGPYSKGLSGRVEACLNIGRLEVQEQVIINSYG